MEWKFNYGQGVRDDQQLGEQWGVVMENQVKREFEGYFYLISIVVVICAGTLWLAQINSLATTSAQDIKDLKSQTLQRNNEAEELRTRLTHMEDDLAYIKKELMRQGKDR